MDRPPEQVMEAISAIEGMAEEVLADRQQIVDLDRRRQKTREAIRSMKKDGTKQKKWVCFGDMFIKMEKGATEKLLNSEFEKLDDEINSTRNGLKIKVNKLRDLEHKEEAKGFQLTALTRDEKMSLDGII